MIILGIDPGIATTGFGVIHKEGNAVQLIDYGVITTPAGLDLGERLVMLREDMESILHLHKPDTIGVEQLFFCTNVKTAITVAHARGVVLESSHRYGARLFEYTPLQVKQSVTGDGSADKKQVQEMVRLHLNLQAAPKQDDAADALAVALCLGQNICFDDALRFPRS